MSSSILKRNWRTIAVVALGLLAALPVLRAALVITEYWLPLPRGDAWQTPGAHLLAWHEGRLRVADLLRLHNEHRVFFPTLIVLAGAIPFGWDFRGQIAFDFLLILAALPLLYLLLRRTVDSPIARAAALAVMSTLLFAPRCVDGILTGLLSACLFPPLALLGMLLMNLSQRSLGAKVVVNAALGVVATYSFASGLFVWLFGFPIGGAESAQARRGWRALYLLVAVAAIGAYFVGYEKPAHHPAPASISELPSLLRFLFIWLSNLFVVDAAELVGALLLAAFLALSLVAARSIYRGADWRAFYPWVVLGVYSLALGAVTARGRLGFGDPREDALHVRYTAVTVFFWVALVGLVAVVMHRFARRSFARRALLASTLLAVALLAIAVRSSMAEQRRELPRQERIDERLLLAMRLAVAVPKNPDLRYLNPYPELAATIEQLAHHDVLRPRPISHTLAAQLQQPPHALDNASGLLERVERDPQTGAIVFSGWAWLPDVRRAADCVVIGYDNEDGTWTPLNVVLARSRRPDVAEHFGIAEMKTSGFKRTLRRPDLPPNQLTFRACAVDLKSERVWPLAGEIVVPPR